MKMQGYRNRPREVGDITLKIPENIADQLRVHHRIACIGESSHGGRRTTLDSFVMQIIEEFLVTHRSNRLKYDMTNYHDRSREE